MTEKADELSALTSIVERMETLVERLENLTSPIHEDPIPPVLKVVDVAKILGVGRNTVYKLANTPGFPARRFGQTYFFNRDGLFAWLNNKDWGE